MIKVKQDKNKGNIIKQKKKLVFGNQKEQLQIFESLIFKKLNLKPKTKISKRKIQGIVKRNYQKFFNQVFGRDIYKWRKLLSSKRNQQQLKKIIELDQNAQNIGKILKIVEK